MRFGTAGCGCGIGCQKGLGASWTKWQMSTGPSPPPGQGQVALQASLALTWLVEEVTGKFTPVEATTSCAWTEWPLQHWWGSWFYWKHSYSGLPPLTQGSEQCNTCLQGHVTVQLTKWKNATPTHYIDSTEITDQKAQTCKAHILKSHSTQNPPGLSPVPSSPPGQQPTWTITSNFKGPVLIISKSQKLLHRKIVLTSTIVRNVCCELMKCC